MRAKIGTGTKPHFAKTVDGVKNCKKKIKFHPSCSHSARVSHTDDGRQTYRTWWQEYSVRSASVQIYIILSTTFWISCKQV